MGCATSMESDLMKQCVTLSHRVTELAEQLKEAQVDKQHTMSTMHELEEENHMLRQTIQNSQNMINAITRVYQREAIDAKIDYAKRRSMAVDEAEISASLSVPMASPLDALPARAAATDPSSLPLQQQQSEQDSPKQQQQPRHQQQHSRHLSFEPLLSSDSKSFFDHPSGQSDSPQPLVPNQQQQPQQQQQQPPPQQEEQSQHHRVPPRNASMTIAASDETDSARVIPSLRELRALLRSNDLAPLDESAISSSRTNARSVPVAGLAHPLPVGSGVESSTSLELISSSGATMHKGTQHTHSNSHLSHSNSHLSHSMLSSSPTRQSSSKSLSTTPSDGQHTPPYSQENTRSLSLLNGASSHFNNGVGPNGTNNKNFSTNNNTTTTTTTTTISSNSQHHSSNGAITTSNTSSTISTSSTSNNSNNGTQAAPAAFDLKNLFRPVRIDTYSR